MRLRVTLEYDGTDFQGWQLQPEGRSVQAVLEAAIEQIGGAGARATAAGRTDAGVHARGQVVHFDAPGRLSPREWHRALNAVLPGDVAALEVRPAAPGFDARRDALWKRYVYRLLTRSSPSPLRHRFSWHVRGRLEVEAMRSGAALLVGRHDFAAFRGKRGVDPPSEDTRRTLDRLEIQVVGDEIQFRAEARSFLRHMVRNLAGTLVEVGRGRRSPEDLPTILASRERGRAGPTAPARGLCLEAVIYPETLPRPR